MTSLPIVRRARLIPAALVVLVGLGGCARHRATVAPSETIIVKVQEDPKGSPGTMLVVDSQAAPVGSVAKTPGPTIRSAEGPRTTTSKPEMTMPIDIPTKAVDAPSARPMPILIPAADPKPEDEPVRPVTLDTPKVTPVKATTETIVPVKAEMPSTQVRSLPGMPVAGTEPLTLTSSADSRFAHSANYSWIVGELEYLRSRNSWRVRFTTPGEADAIGGTVTLAGADSQMEGLAAGTVVRIEGALIDPESRETSPRYQVRSIRKETVR